MVDSAQLTLDDISPAINSISSVADNNNSSASTINPSTNYPVEALRCSPHITEVLKTHGINVVADLLPLTDVELQELTGLRPSSVKKISEGLRALVGIELGHYLANLSTKYPPNPENPEDAVLLQPIDQFNLSPRTMNALYSNEIKNLYDYLMCDCVGDLRGFGSKSRDEMDRLIDSINMNPEAHLISKRPAQSFYEFIQSQCTERERDLLERYFGLIDDQPLIGHAIAEHYGITSSRLHQILQKGLHKVIRGVASQQIIPETLRDLRQTVAAGGQRINQIAELDSFYTNLGIVRLLCRIEPFSIYGRHLKHAWLIPRDKQRVYDWDFVVAKNLIRESNIPLPLSELAEKSGISEKMLADLDGFEILDGQISTQKIYRMTRAQEYMLKVGRPVKVAEIAELVDIPIEQARNLLLYMPEAVNIGRSVYALKEQGFSNASTVELVYKIIADIDDPVPRQQIYDYVQHYRQIGKSAVDLAIYDNPDLFMEFASNTVGLADWEFRNYQPAEKTTRPTYEIPAETAVLEIINNADEPLTSDLIRERIRETYGDRASSKAPTVMAALSALVKARQIRQLKLSQAAVYMKKG